MSELRERLAESWRAFRDAAPGQRFAELNRRRERSGHALLSKLVYVGAGLLTVGAGLVSYPIPGPPSNLIILLGVALIAQGSRRGARALDWAELRLQPPIRAALRGWEHLPPALRVAAALLWLLFLVALTYGLYRLL